MQGKVPNLVANERFQPLWLIEGFNLGGFENNPMFGDQWNVSSLMVLTRIQYLVTNGMFQA